MIRILLQRFAGKGSTEWIDYLNSYQFRVPDSISERKAMKVILETLRNCPVLVESKHRNKA